MHGSKKKRGKVGRNRTAAVVGGAVMLLLDGTVMSAPAGKKPASRFEYESLLTMLRDSVRNAVDVQLLDRGQLWYRAWGAWTLPHSIHAVADIALDFKRYPTVFTHVYRCDRVTEPEHRVARLGTWYLEGRAPPARVWSIGNVDTIWWNADSTEMHLTASQNDDKRLESVWREVLPGWMNFRTRGLRLAACVVARGDDSCRVGVVAEMRVSKPMPRWLVKLAVQIVLPRLLHDLDLAIPRPLQGPGVFGRRWWPW